MYTNVRRNALDSSLHGLYCSLFPTRNGYLKATPDYASNLEVLTDYCLAYVSSGGGVLRYPEKEYVLNKGNVFVLFPNTPYRLHTNPHDLLEYWWVGFAGSDAEQLLEAVSLTIGSPIMRAINNSRFVEDMEHATLSYKGSLPSQVLNLTSILYKLFSILLEECDAASWRIVNYCDSSVTYHGTWEALSSPLELSGGEHYTHTPGSYAEFSFFGTGIRWYGVKSYDCGMADVLLDGVYQTTVDTYHPHRLSQQLLYTNTALGQGHHTIKIICTGEKNPQSSRADVVIDAFRLLATKEYDNDKHISLAVSQLISRAKEYMETNYAQAISIEQMADDLGVSRAYFTTKFKVEVGMAPSDFLTSLRLRHAKYYLATTRLPIGEIATAVGFRDAYYFSRLFRKIEHTTPSAYRTAHANDHHDHDTHKR